ncbi:unnamed protein product [Cylicocyclus nassatus]|uniref:Uncharacterized protein n=1 Tax=Cylicocyclus nassatus TaxID=53992 RepID=A0AA36H478_CYLNA|nr:unnamed protein product [Cylicocyclus nassatus]
MDSKNRTLILYKQSFTYSEKQNLSMQVRYSSVPLQQQTAKTLLIVAARANNAHAVRCLSLDQNVLNETDNEGWSALLNAAYKRHFDIVKILLEAGDLPDMMGWSPLI